MTHGVAVIIGPVGRNFAAGMSGGIAFVLDEDSSFARRCNLGSVAVEPVVEPEDIDLLLNLLQRHAEFTGSCVAERLLEDRGEIAGRFAKVMPVDYKRVLMARRAAEEPAA
jgi:glutamate synthase (NADPH/NADH) large chain